MGAVPGGVHVSGDISLDVLGRKAADEADGLIELEAVRKIDQRAQDGPGYSGWSHAA